MKLATEGGKGVGEGSLLKEVGELVKLILTEVINSRFHPKIFGQL
jgi:hypothetical protein